MATAASIEKVQKAYFAYYGRPGDPEGLDFWAEQLDSNGGDINAMLTAFGTSDEATSLWASFSITDAVNQIYQQVLGRDGDEGANGAAFYVTRILSGEFSLVDVAQRILDGATSTVDATIVANKLEAANSFTQYLRDNEDANAAYVGDNAAGNARNWLANVDGSDASVTTATSGIEALVEVLASAPTNPGAIYVLTTTSTGDTFNGTAKDDTFNASTLNSLQSADRLLDATTSDADVLNATVTSALTPTLAPTATNIETINLTGANTGVRVGIDLTNVAGTNTLNLDTANGSGTAIVLGANTLRAENIVIGDNVTTARITAAASGTRDSVTVDLNGASGLITGAAGADSFTVILGEGSDLYATSMGALDSITLVNDGTGVVTTSNFGSALGKLTIAASGDATFVFSSSGIANGLASGVVVSGGGVVTLDNSGNEAFRIGSSDMVASTASDTESILKVGLLGSADAANFSTFAIDDIRVAQTAASSTATLQVHADSKVSFSAAVSSTITLQAGTGDVTTGSQELTLDLYRSQTGAIVNVGSSIGSLFITNATGGTVVVPEINQVGSAFETLGFLGTNNITVTEFVANASSETTIIASGLTGNLRLGVSAAAADYNVSIIAGAGNDVITFTSGSGDIAGGAGNDTITVTSASATTVNGDLGNDTLIASTANVTLRGGAGDDILVTSGSSTIMNGGAGADTFRLDLANASATTIQDFAVGTDVLQITSLATSEVTLDTSSITPTSGRYTIGASTVTLTGNTATDLSGSFQLGGGSLTRGLDLQDSTATVTSGAFDDIVQVGGIATASLTLGGGNDAVIFQASSDVVTITDFDADNDLIVLAGTVGPVNVYNITADSDGLHSIGSSDVTLQIAGVATMVTDMSDVVQFGYATGNLALLAGSATLGTNNDFIGTPTGSAFGAITVTVKDGGGVDYFFASADTAGSAAGSILMDYELTGINTAKYTHAANASKVADAVNGAVYLVADSTDGTGTSRLNYVGGASGSAASIDDVFTFIGDNFGGMTTGEKFLVAINDTSGDAAYAYYINIAGSFTSDDIELVSIFEGINLTVNNLQT